LNEPCRIIHAESDDLPALIVDRFDDTLCAELYSETAVHLWDTISPILHKELGTQHHLLRFDEKSARAENAQPLELRSNSCPNLLKISENGIRYEVDLRDGHKTGFFCDQRLNRQKIRAEVERVIATKGHCSVLDICTYTGGFALAAAVGGATEVQGVDLDEKAIAVAKRNANLNQTTKVRFTHSDAFPWLRQAFENGSRFDIVIVDPPKFIPNRSKWDEGIAKYHDLNKVAAPLLEEGGLMLTCSCSALLPMSDFQEKVRQATKRLGRPLRIEAATGAGPDHPVRLDFPEGAYLKALWLRG
jgi:23S rRNA (cytosine1962-C5)-methyltransferase